MMLINGMRIDASSIDEMNTHSYAHFSLRPLSLMLLSFRLIEVLEAEARRIQFLVDTGMSISEANAYLVSSVSSRVAPEQPVVDVRSDFMMYLNDLETEPQYARMGSLRDVRIKVFARVLLTFRVGSATGLPRIAPVHSQEPGHYCVCPGRARQRAGRAPPAHAPDY